MRYQTSIFSAWQEAERLAGDAEHKLFAKVCDPDCSALPSQEELAHARELRLQATLLMKQMLQEMQELAELLKCSRENPGAPLTVVGFRTGQLDR
ncbi:MAG TPA: hypothetical protein VGD76_00405, partial [Ramlibacter sp.]